MIFKLLISWEYFFNGLFQSYILDASRYVFSDALSSSPISGYMHHIGSDSNPGLTLEEPSRLLDRDVLRSCKNKTDKAGLRPFL